MDMPLMQLRKRHLLNYTPLIFPYLNQISLQKMVWGIVLILDLYIQ